MRSRPLDEVLPCSELLLAGETSTLAAARRFATDAAARLGYGEAVQAAAATVASELAINAVQSSPGRRYRVSVRLDDDGFSIEVVNDVDDPHMPGRHAWGPEEPLARRGRGLDIVDKLTDVVDIRVDRRAGQVAVVAVLADTA